ncbi:MAG: XrtA/PEP-CTERM system amidotransferase [Pseudomonadota bacterium]
MCGIAGIFDTKGVAPIARADLELMNARQFHRGPDEGGIFEGPGIGLAHRRLSIIDLSHGQQPMASTDQQTVVCFNGEIYNFRELRADLEALGHRFRTNCDTEVLLEAWRAWGEDCVRRLRGMFAFAIWDERTHVLFLARDRLGIKPLFYHIDGAGVFRFASEMKAIEALIDTPRTIEPRALDDYLAYGYVPDPQCFFAGFQKLAPAHTLTIERGKPVPQPKRYWDLRFVPRHNLKLEDAEEELRVHMDEAVRLRMVADVPLGAFLSGGVDSSAVVASMAKAIETPVNSCAIEFDDPRFNEGDFADQVAAHCGTAHWKRVVRADDHSLVETLADLYDEPFADNSAMPTYRVCELARERVIVALSGDGGDEVFAGYRRYRLFMAEEQVRRRMPFALRRSIFGPLGRLYPKLDWAPQMFRAKTTFQALARSSAEAYFRAVSYVGDEDRNRLLSDRHRSQVGDYHPKCHLTRAFDEADANDPLNCAQYADMRTYLPGDILTKVDRASMAHALEVRVPLLDHKFVEWSATLPPAMKLAKGEGKAVFKSAQKPRLPNNILYRKKMGFVSPISQWFRRELKDRAHHVVTSAALLDSGAFDARALTELYDQHQSGQRDHGRTLWSLMMLEAVLNPRKDTHTDAPSYHRADLPAPAGEAA